MLLPLLITAYKRRRTSHVRCYRPGKLENLRREFTSNVSHELKTPLHSIAGYSELLQNNIAADEDRQAFARIIHNEAVHMMDLINDIIKLSHLDEGVPELKEEDIILRNEIESCTQSLKVEAEKKNVSVDADCAENISVRGIPQFVREIIHNLMDNAIKYNTYGGSVTVSAYDAGGSVLLSRTQESVYRRMSRQEYLNDSTVLTRVIPTLMSTELTWVLP